MILKNLHPSKKTQMSIFEDTMSKIKHELMYYLSDEYGWFWHSETDVMKDYKYYFSQHNSANLSEKYPGKKILKKKSRSWKVISK